MLKLLSSQTRRIKILFCFSILICELRCKPLWDNNFWKKNFWIHFVHFCFYNLSFVHLCALLLTDCLFLLLNSTSCPWIPLFFLYLIINCFLLLLLMLFIFLSGLLLYNCLFLLTFLNLSSMFLFSFLSFPPSEMWFGHAWVEYGQLDAVYCRPQFMSWLKHILSLSLSLSFSLSLSNTHSLFPFTFCWLIITERRKIEIETINSKVYLNNLTLY